MNEEMEAELIKTDSRPDNFLLSEDASFDESFPIDIRKERKKKHTKRQWAKILKTLTLMKLKQKLIQQNGGQYMRL